MNAFKFGVALLQKIAASVSQVPKPAPVNNDPDWTKVRNRYATANIPEAAWKHVGLPAMTPEQLRGASARDIWHINDQFSKAKPAVNNATTPRQQVSAFNTLRTYATNTAKQYKPTFAPEGAPGYKPPLSSITGLAPPPNQAAGGVAAPPVQAPQPGQAAGAGMPVPPNPRQFGRQLGGQARFPNWQQGNPLPPNTILADDGFPIAKDPNLARIEAMQ